MGSSSRKGARADRARHPRLTEEDVRLALLATGADVPYVMAQLGHEDPKMTLGVYAKVIASKTDHGAAVDGLVGASDWAPMGRTADPAEVDA
jgi:integrase